MNSNSADNFWAILAEVEQNEKALSVKLHSMSRDEIGQFYHGFLDAATDLQCPPYTDNLEGASEDTIADLAEYVVSKGRSYYKEVLQNPERMPKEVPSNSPAIKGTALTVFWDKFGESIPRD